MLAPRRRGTSMPSLEESQRLQSRMVVETMGPSEADLAELHVPASWAKQLKEEWKGLRHVTHVRMLRAELDCHESREGFVVLFCQYDGVQGRIKTGVILLPGSESEGLEEEEELEIVAGDGENLMRDDAFWESVWTPFTACEPLKADKKLRPNDLCSCGSSKKAKHCGCGAF